MKNNLQFTISRDVNGNKTCRIKAGSARAFSIQTLGNLPATHRLGIGDHTRGEVSQFVASFGTDNQRKALAAFDLLQIAKAYRNLLKTMATSEGEIATFEHIEAVILLAEGQQ